MKASLLLLVPLLSPLAGNAASLDTGSSSGDTAGVVATCLLGGGPDVRGCTDSKDQASVTASTVLDTAAWATYANGNVAQSSTSASLGTLKAEAVASIPSSDAMVHNLQSHAESTMRDTLKASSSLGSLFDNYQYTVNISGLTTPSNATGDFPSIKAFAYVQFEIVDNATGAFLVNDFWQTSDSSLGGGLITGKLMGVSADTELSLYLDLYTSAGVETLAAGQSGFASANYIDTVHFYLDALTPGANTVSEAGYDYATPVPEPATAALLAVGLAAVGSSTRRRRSVSP